MVAVLLGGCASGPSNSPTASELKLPDTIPMVRRSQWSLAANTQGRLVIRQDCLVLENPNGIMTVAWPSPGTEWDPAQGVVTLDGVSARLGDEVVLRGGETQIPGEPGSYDWVSEPSAGCLQNPVAWLATELEVVPPRP